MKLWKKSTFLYLSAAFVYLHLVNLSLFFNVSYWSKYFYFKLLAIGHQAGQRKRPSI